MSEPRDQRDDITQGEDVSTQALTQALKGGFVIMYVVIFALLAYFFFSNWFRLNAGETAVVLRLGKPLQTGGNLLQEGELHFAWPYPIDEKVIVIGGRQEITSTIGWHAPSQRRDPQFDAINDGYAIGRDLNIIHIQVTLDYTIQDPERYNFDFFKDSQGGPSHVEVILQNVVDNAITRTIPNFKGEDLAKGGAQAAKFRSEVTGWVMKKVEEYELGVQVEGVRLASDKQGVGAVTWPRGTVQRWQAILEQNEATHGTELGFAHDKAAEYAERSKSGVQSVIDRAKREAKGVADRVEEEYNEFNDIYKRCTGADGTVNEDRILIELERLRNEKLLEVLKSGNVVFYVVPTLPNGMRVPVHMVITPPPPKKPTAVDVGGPPEDIR